MGVEIREGDCILGKTCEYVRLICSYCGDSFEKVPSIAYGKAKKHFCSKKCSNIGKVLTLEKLLEKCNKTTNGCIEWPGGLCGKYGVTNYKNKTITTHKLSYILANGSIPKGLIVRHTCDNPVCCNPEHLILGTYKQNSQDMVDRNRQCKGERMADAKLKESDINKIRGLYKFGQDLCKNLGVKQSPLNRYSLGGLAKMYNVSEQTIHRVIKGKTWKHVPHYSQLKDG